MRHWVCGACLLIVTSACKSTPADTPSNEGDPSPGAGEPPQEVPTNVTDIYFGDALPSPLVVNDLGVDDAARGSVSASVVRDGPPPSFFPAGGTVDELLLPGVFAERTGTMATSITKIVPPMSGTYRLAFLADNAVSQPFVVHPRRPAYVQCLDATVLAGASSQDPEPFRARLGTCTMSRSGGDTVTKVIAQASCTTAKGKSECAFDQAQHACVGSAVPIAMRRAPGDVADVAWSGGDVPAGAVAGLVVPQTVELKNVPTTQSMGSDLEVTFTGGAPGAVLRMSLLQTSSGSPVAIDCDVQASSGRVVLPKAMFLLLQAAEAQLNFTYASRKVVPLDAWEVDVSVPGLVNRNGTPLDLAIPITLQP